MSLWHCACEDNEWLNAKLTVIHEDPSTSPSDRYWRTPSARRRARKRQPGCGPRSRHCREFVELVPGSKPHRRIHEGNRLRQGRIRLERPTFPPFHRRRRGARSLAPAGPARNRRASCSRGPLLRWPDRARLRTVIFRASSRPHSGRPGLPHRVARSEPKPKTHAGPWGRSVAARRGSRATWCSGFRTEASAERFPEHSETACESLRGKRRKHHRTADRRSPQNAARTLARHCRALERGPLLPRDGRLTGAPSRKRRSGRRKPRVRLPASDRTVSCDRVASCDGRARARRAPFQARATPRGSKCRTLAATRCSGRGGRRDPACL